MFTRGGDLDPDENTRDIRDLDEATLTLDYDVNDQPMRYTIRLV